MSKKLYRVKIRGGFSSTSTDYSMSYVVAQTAEAAHEKVKSFLDKQDLCFRDDREMDSVELLAEDKQYPACRTILFL